MVKLRATRVETIAKQHGWRGAILHDDGTMGVYLHLMRHSVLVAEGQRVQVGTPLARSGNTGNSSGPHLHFVIQRNVGLALESIPYDFAQPVDSLPNFAIVREP